MAVHLIEHGDHEFPTFFTEVVFDVSIPDVAEEAFEEVAAERLGGGCIGAVGHPIDRCNRSA